jgi:Skp family chaperone for outer membrane proteins
MRKLLVSAAIAASVMAPAAAQAQALPPATIAVVDLEKVTTDCTSCKNAQNALTAQVNALKAREKTLGTPIQAEQKSLQTAIEALGSKEPDAALRTRIQAFQSKQQSAAEEISRQQQQIQRNQAYIQQQIQTKLGPIYQSVMTKRGANIMVEVGSTLATSASVDVTNDIVASLNAALPSIQTIAPAAPAKPQGR